MDVIQEITAKTAEGSNRASGSIGELSVMVKEMQTSVAGFKLPGIDPAASTIIHNPEDLAALGVASIKAKK
jgi:twitching motility protein PilJ